MTLKNDRLIRAMRRQPVDETPVWIMRQAGRYLPEYRKLRASAGDFMTLCQTPELACEVTLQPLNRFNLDAAILFSDILTIPDAMGLGLSFKEGEGPVFARPIQSLKDIEQLPEINIEESLGYVTDAVALIKKELDGKVPLIGFTGSPWTLACYMLEGGASKNFSKIKGLLYREPKALGLLLDKLTVVVIDYLNAQIRNGADAVMIFDTWGGVLTTANYKAYSLAYINRVIAGLDKKRDDQHIPVTMFTKGGGQWLEMMLDSGADCIGIDWTTQLKVARRRLENKVAIQGNIDPCALYGSEETIHRVVSRTMSQYGHGAGHVFNLGHGIHPDIEPEKVGYLVDLVHEVSRHYHGG